MPRKRYSIIWKIPKEELETMVKEEQGFAGVLRRIGIGHNNVKTLRKRLIEDNIDYSHFDRLAGIRSHQTKNKIKTEDILVENSTYSRCALKKRLVEEKLLEYKCAKCDLTDEWNGEKLSLQLDHINGIPNDNRLENLRFLCPNCHSQTDNFAGKKLREKHYCECGKEIHKRSKKCKKCAAIVRVRNNRRETVRGEGNGFNRRKVDRPSREELERLAWEKPTVQIAKEYGVSDKAVEKWCKSYNIEKPPRGYWQKRRAAGSPDDCL